MPCKISIIAQHDSNMSANHLLKILYQEAMAFDLSETIRDARVDTQPVGMCYNRDIT